MTEKWKLRPATRADLETLLEFQQIMAYESEGMRIDPPTLRRGVERVFSSPEIGVYSILENAGDAVGCVLLQREWSDWRARWVYWIHSLYVVPEMRRAGAFRFIYSELRARVQADPEAGGLRLYVDLKNETAQRAYERVGMHREHYFLYEWLKENGPEQYGSSEMDA